LILAVAVFFVYTAASMSALDVNRDIISKARRFIGNSYCTGGAAPPCFDCSGFVVYIYRPHLPRLPRISRDMVRFGSTISRDEVLPGDLLFFATGPDPSVITHVSIYIGQNSIIHAISDGPNRGINITELTSRYWRTRYHSAISVFPPESWGGGPASTAGTGETVTDRSTTSGPLQFARGMYTGGLLNGEPHGEGTMKLNNGDTYKGRFAEGLFNGEGTYTWTNGAVYRGEFRDGVIEGEGTFTLANGNEYTGEFHEGYFHGEGPEQATTYFQVDDSPWDTWEGYIRGDYERWQEWLQQEERDFEEWKKNN
jgi:hypothetical protein